MRRRITKISLFIGLVMMLLLLSIASQINSQTSNMDSLLTRAEMMRTYGRCDCTGTYPVTDACTGDTCPGCASGSTSASCTDVITVGTGNAVDHCTAESTPDGICKQDHKVNCTDTVSCLNDSGQVGELTCSSASGNCIEGDEVCRECTATTPSYLGTDDKIWTYICDF